MTPEVHDVVIWSRGLDRADEILADLESRFRVLDVFRVEWSRARFGRCLSRFYEDSTMGPGSAKERHIGSGPFLLAVVYDSRPAYARRATSRGDAVVHEELFDAKARYRALTGGGHRVHGSLSALEADRDLFFLLGRRAASFRPDKPWDGTIQQWASDVIGVGGWRDRPQLLTDLELSLPYVVLEEEPTLSVLLHERWWADVVAAVHDQPRRSRRLTIPVGGSPLELAVSHVGDGLLNTERQRSILRGRVRDGSGLFVPADEDERCAALAALAREYSPRGAYWRRFRSSLRR
jgi:hypothetical protein